MRIFPRGAEWRKWDLHVHAPGTKLNDNYGTPLPWDRYCAVIEESDVAVVGITDYFSLDCFFEFRVEYEKRYPKTEKVFFPNLELRLNESVNAANDIIHIHLLFRPDLDKATAESFLAKLKVQHTDGSGRNPTCAELKTDADFESATVSRQDIQDAIQATFGKEPYASDRVLQVVPANNDGLRAADSQRKRRIADEIEKQCHALFGNAQNTEYFLLADRYEDKSVSASPKPVFSGSDAHSLSDLEAWLGKTVDTPEQQKAVTWIKADPTFEGLQQTLAEPRERVRIQPTRPDAKEPYKVITAVRFAGSTDFPSEIVFNQNLVSIIGSRSSGKSALLAYIAHAVDPDETEKQQLAVEPLRKPDRLGPAAGITWDDVKTIQCTVEWGASTERTGHIIYVPQNSLHAISQRPDEITAKIEPTVFRLDAEFETAFRKASLEVDSANDAIRTATETWFRQSEALLIARKELRDVGDKAAIEETRSTLLAQIETLRKASSLTAQESADYQALVDRLAAIEARVKVIEDDRSRLAPYLDKGTDEKYTISARVRLEIQLSPDLSGLPSNLETRVRKLVDDAKTALTTEIAGAVVGHHEDLDSEKGRLVAEDQKLRSENAALIAKNAANAEIEALVKSKQKQDEALEDISRRTKDIELIEADQATRIAHISAELARRDGALGTLDQEFQSKKRKLALMSFGLEQAFGTARLDELAGRFNKHEVGPVIDRATKRVDIEKAHASPAVFLDAMFSGAQKVIHGQDPRQVAADVLTTTKENRFYAEMEGDRIGGFRESSMTPGKQALFALTLILNESDDAWPLLIDQPEDDLDSRSVYDVLVGYLTARKQERQIIMVSHNANLVIGADSEQIVVANRHGADRPNAGDRQFDYFTGSLEHSEPKKSSSQVLDSCGIREHACELLDGGEEAFRKRRAKYKL
jgi:ABC-type cobalamin/Fe3+-siderophores transport system ATPase subunit